MKRELRLCLLFLFTILSSAAAQFPQTLALEATAPTIVRSAPTRAGWQYTITVSGTYSMWPPYDRFGVDAAYVYDVPQEEVAAFRWPPAVIYPIPHWVGDTLEVPPFTIPGMQFKFRTRDNIGFRYNGQPLADRGLDAAHRYQTTLVGDGRPIEFQILDSAYSLREGRIIPRYEDNSGALTILVEERPLFNVCDVETYCAGGSMHLAIASSLLEYDDSTGRPENVLDDRRDITVMLEDGRVLDADSISCGSRTPVAYTLVLDRSGSMNFAYQGATDRMTALKRAAHGFLKTMKPGDQAMLVTFSYDDDITLDVAWTGDTARLGRGIDAIEAVGGTAWRDAAWVGLDHASKHYNPLKAVVLLTDGDDTHSRRTLQSVVAKSRQVNVPVFTIGMALVDSSEAPLRYLATQSNGRFFQARDQRAIDSAFGALSRAIESDGCCTAYLTLPHDVTATSRVLRFTVVATRGTVRATQTHEVWVSDSCSVPSAVEPAPVLGEITLAPNPTSAMASLALELRRAGVLTVEAVSSEGRVERIVVREAVGAGARRVAIDTKAWPSGMYAVRVTVDGVEVAQERLVVVR